MSKKIKEVKKLETLKVGSFKSVNAGGKADVKAVALAESPFDVRQDVSKGQSDEDQLALYDDILFA